MGGINLEDIRAPDCFYIEQTLREALKIPVFHDDQHGTAIISGAALLNALELVTKNIADVRVVFSGAGAAALSTAEHYVRLGVKRENITMCDLHGVVYAGRTVAMDPYKARFARDTPMRTITEALVGADVFVGLSAGGAITGAMIAGMAERPIIFALANPVPEILPDEVRAVRDRRDHRHRPLRLSEPGQQRPRLSVHLPRRARRARDADQRGDEDGGDARARLARQAGRARQRRAALRIVVGDVREGVHHPVRVRSARAALGGAGRGVGGRGDAASRRTSSISTTTAWRSRRGSAARAGSCAGS